MKTHISEQPAHDASAYIAQKISDHKEQHILFLISGGSSLSIAQELPKEIYNSQITVSTTDERFTKDLQGNNFLQLQQTTFFTEAGDTGFSTIATVPKDGESHSDFALRIQQEFENLYKVYPNTYTIGLFGIGEDGHTAGIFPKSETDFQLTYRTNDFYIPIVQEGILYPQRTTLTPAFIEDKIDDVVLFAVGSNKCDNILNYMHNKNFKQSEIPALIPASHPESILFTDCKTLL